MKKKMYLILKASVRAETGVLSVIYERRYTTKKKLFYCPNPVPSHRLSSSPFHTAVFLLYQTKNFTRLYVFFYFGEVKM